MNKFIGIGRNTKDGELRSSESGVNVYRNTIAITNNFKNKDGNYDSEFINYVAYRTTADYLHKYSKKGSLIELEGRIHNGSYDKDGEKKYYTELVVENAKSYDFDKKDSGKVDGQESGQVEDIPQNATSNYEDSDIQLTDADLPF